MTNRNHLRKSVVVRATGNGRFSPAAHLPEPVGPARPPRVRPMMRSVATVCEKRVMKRRYVHSSLLAATQRRASRIGRHCFMKSIFFISVLNFLKIKSRKMALRNFRVLANPSSGGEKQ
jgi:hypothetical protein